MKNARSMGAELSCLRVFLPHDKMELITRYMDVAGTDSVMVPSAKE